MLASKPRAIPLFNPYLEFGYYNNPLRITKDDMNSRTDASYFLFLNNLYNHVAWSYVTIPGLESYKYERAVGLAEESAKPSFVTNSTFALLIRNLIRTCQQFDDRLRASISA